MNISPYLQDKIAKWLKGTAFPSAPTARFALSSTDPAVSLTAVGTPVNISFSYSNGKLTSTDAIVVSGVSGSADYAAIIDDSDNVLFSGLLSVPRVFAAGDNFSLAAGEVEVSAGGIYAEKLSEYLLNWVNGTAMPAAPSGLFLQLSRSEAFDPPAATDNYEPQECVLTDGVFDPNTGTSMENTDNILFPEANTNSWGVITHVTITDGADAPLITLSLSVPKHVEIGESVGFADKAITFTLS
jgi:hypothetical protein